MASPEQRLKLAELEIVQLRAALKMVARGAMLGCQAVRTGDENGQAMFMEQMQEVISIFDGAEK